jgi:amino acid transporter
MRRKNQGDEHEQPHDTGEHRAHTQGEHSDAGYDEDRQREAYGGINWGAGFFGWLVAVAVSILLISIVGAIAAAVGSGTNVTQSDAEREAGTVGIVAGIILLLILMTAYYTGGYVAGRMSRFDGGKQGAAVWVIGLLVTILAIVLGVVFGSQYNIVDRVSLPTLPISTDDLSLGGVITALAIVVGTLVAAMLGGKVGSRYHRKVDKAAYR